MTFNYKCPHDLITKSVLTAAKTLLPESSLHVAIENEIYNSRRNKSLIIVINTKGEKLVIKGSKQICL